MNTDFPLYLEHEISTISTISLMRFLLKSITLHNNPQITQPTTQSRSKNTFDINTKHQSNSYCVPSPKTMRKYECKTSNTIILPSRKVMPMRNNRNKIVVHVHNKSIRFQLNQNKKLKIWTGHCSKSNRIENEDMIESNQIEIN